jgi:hypothetical protein
MSTVALTPDHNLVYQLREAVQELLAQDRSYWTR